MNETGRTRAIVTASSKPGLPKHVKMRHDAARGTWTILAPERVFTPDAIAVAVLKLCDASRTVEDIARELSLSYNAPQDRIQADVISLLQELADKGVVKV
jgi:pyrroloquinoline quinone biosynthesis protein D